MDSRKIVNWHINILKAFGFWPEKPSSLRYTIWSIVIGVLLFISYPLFQGLCVFFVNTVDEAVVILLLSSTMVTTVMKAVIVRIKQKTFLNLLDVMHQFDQKISFKEHNEFLVPVLKESKLMFISFCSVCYSSWIFLVLQAYLSPPESRLYLSTYFYPGEFLHRRMIYVGGIYYEAISNFFFICTTQSVDLFGPSLLHVLGANVEILCQRFQNFGHGHSDPRKHKADFIELCKLYELIIRYRDLLQEILSLGLVIQFFVSGIVLCTCAFQLTVVDPIDEFLKFTFCVIYAGAMLTEIFIPSHFGSLLHYKSNKIPYAIFQCEWTTMDVSMQKIINTMMLRTIKPIQICSVKMFMLNLTTMLKILKTTYSLFAVLQSMQ